MNNSIDAWNINWTFGLELLVQSFFEILTGKSYLEFLRNWFIYMLDDIPLLARRSYWVMHDGAPVQFFLLVPRSFDLNRLDFCFGGFVNNLVCSQKQWHSRRAMTKKKKSICLFMLKKKQISTLLNHSLWSIKGCVEMRDLVEHLLWEQLKEKNFQGFFCTNALWIND